MEAGLLGREQEATAGQLVPYRSKDAALFYKGNACKEILTPR
jgi:hypothetical protein